MEAHPKRWLILGIMCLALIVASLDNLIITMAIPVVSNQMQSTDAQLQWSVDSYALIFASALIFMGAISDRFGRRRAFVAGMILFGIASGVAAFSPNIEIFIAARIFMGFGGALIMPATLAIVKQIFPKEELSKAMGIWVGVSSMGIPLGPIIGGFLLANFWWGSVFLINIPIILVALTGALVFIPESLDLEHPGLDFTGMFLSVVGSLLLVGSIIQAPERGWVSPEIVILFSCGLLCIILFLWRDRKSDFPMLGESAYIDRCFSVPLLTIATLFFSVFGGLFLVTFILQGSLGFSPLKAGLHLLPICSAILVAPLAPSLVKRFGLAKISAFGPFLIALAMIILAVKGSPDSVSIIVSMLLIGLGIGFGAPASVDSILSSVSKDRAGAGSAVADVAMQGGGALGVALMGSLSMGFSENYSLGFIFGAFVCFLGAIGVHILLSVRR